tara:strand:+ start:1808 stop:5077 length:3270 start_codon:yes stop_codon:yes gene_type:complete
MPRQLVERSSGQTYNFDEKDIEQKIAGKEFDFPMGGKIPVRLKNGSMSTLSPKEAQAVIRAGVGTYVQSNDFEKSRKQEEYNTAGFGAAAAGLGLLDYGTFGLGNAALDALGQFVGAWDEDTLAAIEDQNSGIYHGSGIIGSIGAAIATLGGSTALQAAGHTARAGTAVAGNLGAKQAAKEAAKYVALGKTAAQQGQKMGFARKAAELSAPAVTARAGKLTQEAVAKALGSSALNAKLAAINPTAAKLFSGTTSQVAAGVVEGGLWGAGEGISESVLMGADLEQAAELISARIGTNAFLGGAVGAGFGLGMPLLGKFGTATLGGVGGAANLIAKSPVGLGAARAAAELTGKMRGLSRSEIDDLYTHYRMDDVGRKAHQHLKDVSGELDGLASQVGKQVDGVWVVSEFLQQTDKGAALSPEAVRRGIFSDVPNKVGEVWDHSMNAVKAYRDGFTTINVVKDQLFEISQQAGVDSRAISPLLAVVDQMSAQMAAHFGPSHPMVRAIRDRIDTLVDDAERQISHADLDAAVNLAANGDPSGILRLADNYQVQFSDADGMAKLFVNMHRVANEIHYRFHDNFLPQSRAIEDTTNISTKTIHDFLTSRTPKEGAYPGRQIDPLDNSGSDMVFGRAGETMKEFLDLQSHHGKYRDQLASQFGKGVGPEMLTDLDKLHSWLRTINKHDVNHATEILQGYLQTGDELFEFMAKNFDDNVRSVAFSDRMRKKISTLLEPDEIKGKSDFEIIESYIKESRKKTKESIEYLNSDEVQRAFNYGWQNANAINARGMLTPASFLGFLGGPAVGITVNAVESLYDPKLALARLMAMEDVAQWTKKTMDDAVDGYIDGIGKGRPKGMVRPPVIRAFIGPAMGSRDPKDAERELKKIAKAKITEEQFIESREFISSINRSPSEMEAFLNAAIPKELEATAPETSLAMRVLLRTRLERAFETMPKTMPGELFGVDVMPSTISMASWARHLEAIEDPVTAMVSGMTDGTLTREVVETIQITSPRIYQSMVDRIISKVSDPQIAARIPYRQKLQLANLLGIPVTSPAIAKILQTNYAPENKGKPGPRPSAKKMDFPSGTTMTQVVERQ